MTSIKLQLQKKEISKLDAKTVAEICIKLAKYKTENKEFLNYLLFYSYDNTIYIDDLKSDIDTTFLTLKLNDYTYTKLIKSLLTRLNKHLKFIGQKNREAEILVHFSTTFINKIDVRCFYSGLIQVLYRQYVRLQKVILKLDEDLQFDYKNDLENIYTYLKKTRFYRDI